MDPYSTLLSKAVFGVSDAMSLVAVVVLIALSAFFSSAETAFSSVNVMHIKTYAEEKKKGARRAQYICDNFDRALVGFLVGNNLVNIANTTICAYMFSKFIVNPTLANILNTVIMTIVILIFGEILPKSYAKHNPEKFVLKISGAVYAFLKIIHIVAVPFFWLQKLVLKGEPEAEKLTEDDLENIVDTMEDQGIIDSENASIIHGALDLAEKTVRDIFTPRVDMICIPIDSSIDDIKKVFLENQFSRMPVYENDKDDIVGVLNYKDMILAEFAGKKFDLKKLMQEPLKVGKSMKVDELIQAMQKSQKHMAIVIDEYGGTSGLVTMEDALEEIVGEVYDEHDDTKAEAIVNLGEDKYIVDPDISVEDLFEYLEIEHLPETEYPSVGGMLYELSEILPEAGSIIKVTAVDDILNEKNVYISMIAELTFEIKEMEDNRIKTVYLSIERHEKESEETEEN
ncbi:MAG: HlyC/CorC family transporter [Clostridia bacterium]|nr:HlyC/CorC family transporter [Clostridia bacterium]